jgi:diguanylate cyclase (GGDEF)-like protein
LTGILNRHAFHSLVEKNQATPKAFSGCVAIIDIDNLKPINDTFGHLLGDAAIRAVARATRGVIRADDLLFRWGGDEFLVLMIGIAEPAARARFNRINETLFQVPLPSTSGPIGVQVSHGIAFFDELKMLEAAIERADQEMYTTKQARKIAEGRPLSTPRTFSLFLQEPLSSIA